MVTVAFFTVVNTGIVMMKIILCVMKRGRDTHVQ